MTWKEKIAEILATDQAIPSLSQGERLLFNHLLAALADPSYMFKALIDKHLTQAQFVRLKMTTRKDALKRRLNRRYLKRHGRPHPSEVS